MLAPRNPRPYPSVLDLIGDTPVVQLQSIAGKSDANLFAKLEFMNPGGSIKDRLGVGLIRAAERAGELRPGGTIIEPTAGNTGIGLALVGIRLGYRVILFVPEQFSVEKREIMRALGGEVILTPEAEGMQGAIERAHARAKEIDGAYVAQQFANHGNSSIHYETTGPEIWEQMEGQIDAFVTGSGTGGTFTGVSRYLKEKNPSIHAVLVEPQGSILQGGPKGPHDVEGIGASFIPPVLDMSLVDEFITVPDPPAFAMVARLAREEGLLVGSSAGAHVHAAAQVAARLGNGKTVVTILPDAAERYMSKGIYSKWR